MLRRRPVEVVDDEVDLIDRHLPDHERHAITHPRSSSARYTLVHVRQPNPRRFRWLRDWAFEQQARMPVGRAEQGRSRSAEPAPLVAKRTWPTLSRSAERRGKAVVTCVLGGDGI